MKVSVVSFLLLAASVCSALTVEEQAASLIQCVGAGQGDPAALAALINQFPLDTTSASKFAKTVDLRTVGYDNTKHAKKKRKKVKKCVNKIKKAIKKEQHHHRHKHRQSAPDVFGEPDPTDGGIPWIPNTNPNSPGGGNQWNPNQWNPNTNPNQWNPNTNPNWQGWGQGGNGGRSGGQDGSGFGMQGDDGGRGNGPGITNSGSSGGGAAGGGGGGGANGGGAGGAGAGDGGAGSGTNPVGTGTGGGAGGGNTNTGGVNSNPGGGTSNPGGGAGGGAAGGGGNPGGGNPGGGNPGGGNPGGGTSNPGGGNGNGNGGQGDGGTGAPGPAPGPTPETPKPPATNPNGLPCANPIVRREWSTLSRDDKKAYLDAFKCVHKKPSRYGIGNMSAWDDFGRLHYSNIATIHWVAPFLPYHRGMLLLLEKDLNDCGWKEGQPWIDFGKDAADMSKSPIFDTDPEVGIGGEGSKEDFDLCVYENYYLLDKGPFAGMKFNPLGFEVGLCRRFSDNDYEHPSGKFGPAFNMLVGNDYINSLEKQHPKGFWKWASAMEVSTHIVIHNSLGGGLLRSHTAPLDPLFWMLHGFINLLWVRWQMLAPENMMDFYGPTKGATNGEQVPFDATLDHVLDYKPISTDTWTVKDVIDLTKVCYDHRS